MSRSRLLRIVLPIALLATVGVLLLSASSSASTRAGGSSSLTVVAAPSGPFVPSYTPFSTSNTPYLEGATSLIYEPLVMFNILKPGQIYPWLATSYAFSDGGKKLTFKIRKGVKWSDGQPFTSADVAFTFGLLKRFPALNVQGVSFASVSAPSPTTAVLTFATPEFQELYQISQVLMVAQHVWSKIAKPVTYTDTAPIGTGPYLLKSFNSQQFSLTKNPNYWQKGKPQIDNLRFPQYASNTSADLALEQGQIDWSSIFVPHYQKLYIAKDPTHNRVYLPAIGQFYLCPNDTKYPLSIPAVRQALSLGIDRQAIAVDSEQGFGIASTSPTGLLPGWSNFIAPQYKKLALKYDPAAARALLLKAGFKAGSNGMLLDPKGNPFNLTFVGPSPYTDFMTDMQLMAGTLKKVGINTSVQSVSLSAWTNDYTVGNFDATMCGTFVTPTPYQLYNLEFNPKTSAPVGKAAVGNYERWMDPNTEKLLAQYAATQDPAAQQKALYSLEGIMVKNVPLIPMFGVSSYAEYRTTNATGWVTAGDQYQAPDPLVPWTESVILNLKPTH